MARKALYFVLIYANLPLIGWFWWQRSGPLLSAGEGPMFLALGRLMGLLVVFFVLYQIVLIGRTGWLEKAYGLDKLSLIHHLNGTFLLVFLLAHPVCLALSYGAAANQGFFRQLLIFISQFEDVSGAALALFLFVFIAGYSLYLVYSRVKYELWYFSHLLVYLAIALAFNHQLGLGGDFLGSRVFTAYWYLLYAFAFGSLLAYRFLRPLWLLDKHRFAVEKIVPETAAATSVYITGRNLDQFKARAGQFSILRFLDKSRWWQAHPFSFSLAPGGRILRFTIKNVGDFTSQIKNLRPGTPVLLDGPYGIFTEKSLSQDKLLFIAGGIGITPIRALVEQLARQGKNLILLYANRRQQDIALKKELDELSAAYHFPLHHILSQDSSWAGESGYVDFDRIKRLAPDAAEREVFLCGPAEMMKAVKQDLVRLGIKQKLIHYELFRLG